LAGQGGYGIQTAPALSRLAASLVTGESVPIDISDAGLDPGVLYPARLVDHIATPRQAAAPQ